MAINRNRTFVVSDVGIFERWFESLEWDDKIDLYQLVTNEQITFVSGFWTTPDESITHYSSVINDMTIGRQWLTKHFNDCGNPSIAWQLNAFGHSSNFADILIKSGYEGLFFSRMDQQVKNDLKEKHSLIFDWQPKGTETGNISSKRNKILTIVTPEMYSSPAEFSFESNFYPISKEELEAGTTEMFVNYIKELTVKYGINEVYVLFGSDFSFHNSDIYYKSIDSLIDVIKNEESYGIDIFYSNPNCYIKTIRERDFGSAFKWPTISNVDFIPATDSEDDNQVYSGYFTTNPNVKGDVRRMESLLQTVTQLRAIKAMSLGKKRLRSIDHLKEGLALMQTLTGIGSVSSSILSTETSAILQKTFNKGLSVLSNVFMDITTSIQFPSVVSSDLKTLETKFVTKMSVCPNPFLKMCLIDSRLLEAGFTLFIYNPSLHQSVEFVRVSVAENTEYTVTNWQGYEITSQLTSSVIHIQKEKIESDLNQTDSKEYYLYFKAVLPPLGITSFAIKKVMNPDISSTPNSVDYISNSKLKIIFDQKSGLLESVFIKKTSQLINLKQKFIAYRPSSKSSHLILDFAGEATELSINAKLISVHRGSIVQELNQVVNEFINQSIRLYQDKGYIEFEYSIGQIPEDNLGLKLLSRFDSDLSSSNFFTDSNCRGRRQHQNPKLTRLLDITPKAENHGKYFSPIVCYASIRDDSKNIQMNVFVDRPLGVTSSSGKIDLLIHRRVPFKNSLFNEEVSYTDTVSMRNWLDFEQNANELNRFSKKLVWQPVILFNPQEPIDNNYSNDELPIYQSFLNQTVSGNIHLLTMEIFTDYYADSGTEGTSQNEAKLLLRFENISNNETVVMDIEYLFKNVRIINLDRMALPANIAYDQIMRKGMRSNSVDTGDLNQDKMTVTSVKIEPHEIETMIATFNAL